MGLEVEECRAEVAGSLALSALDEATIRIFSSMVTAHEEILNDPAYTDRACRKALSAARTLLGVLKNEA
jgi:hypothetical protein